MIELINSKIAIYEHDGSVCKISINRNEQTDETLFKLGRGKNIQYPSNPFMEVIYKGNTIYIH